MTLDKGCTGYYLSLPKTRISWKGMVISVDKYTAVKMYDKVQHYWAIESRMKERNTVSLRKNVISSLVFLLI